MVRKNDKNILVFLLVTMYMLQVSLCLQQVEVYKMFAYENGENIIGSKVSSFNLVSQHYKLDIFRKIALIHFNELSESNLVELLLKRPFGMLVILPKSSQNELQMIKNLITAIKGKQSKLIVYFIWEDKFILDIYNQQEQKQLQFSVKQTEPQLIKNLQLEDFYGYLQEIKTQNQLPTILLIASYDSFIPSAELKVGFNAYKSGAYTLLNIMKYLKDQTQYYQNLQYNVMFYLTSSKHNDFQQVNNWINRPENQKYTGAIQYAFYLDSLANSSEIYLKQNQNYDLPYEILVKIEKTAKIYNIKLNKQKQDVYENQKTNFVCFSNDEGSIKEPIKPILTDSEMNQEVLNKNLQFLSETILKIIYNMNFDFKIIDDNQFIKENQHFQQNTMDYLKDYSFYPTNIQKNSYINKQIYQYFNQFSMNSNKISNYFNQLQFYSSYPSKMTISENVSPFFDIQLFMAIIMYLFLLNKSLTYIFEQ